MKCDTPLWRILWCMNYFNEILKTGNWGVTICKSTSPLTIYICKSTPPFTFHIWLNMIMMHGYTSKDSTMQNHLTYAFTNINVKVHLHLHWLIHHQLHHQVFTSIPSTSHNSTRVIIISSSQNHQNNHHHNHHQHISIHTYTIKSSPIACTKIHQQHICIYTYIIHQHLHHSNSTSIIMVVNKHHHNCNALFLNK